MPMYQLTPTFPADFDVSPKDVCYRIASYHNPTAGQNNGQVKQETDPRKSLEQKQHELVEQLKAQTEKLNSLLVNFGKTSAAEKQAAPTKKEKVALNTAAAPAVAQPTGKDNKKDKDAKKEARKAAKAEAVKKVASGEVPATKGKTGSAEGKGWTVEDDRKTWEHGLSLTVNLPASLVVYPQEHLGQATLTVTPADQQWASLLAKVGEKRQVAFNGTVSNKANDAKTTVKTVSGSETSLVFEKTTVKCLETIWKVLGLALGLFSRRSQQALSASHQSLWLNKAEKIIRGSGDLAFTTRKASQFLARFDSLSSQWEISVADVIIRSLLNTADSHPNNVEVWAKKIDKLLA